MKRALLCAALGVVVAACGDDARPAADAGAGGDGAQIDAPPAPCGLPAPGAACASATLLQRCVGDMIEDVDCAAMGRLCGPDPAGPDGAACVGAGDPCGAIDFYGACAGDVLAYCSSGSDTLVVVDCTASYGICGWESADIGYNCTTECALANVPAEGECDGAAAIRRCDFANGAYTAVTIACPPGTSCQTVDETGWPGCLPDLGCSTVGPQGRCAGDTLTRCVTGAPQSTNCAAAGQVCGYGGDAAGYVCADPGDMGALAVSGVVRYEDRPPGPTGLGPIAPVPARGVAVALLRDADGAVLAAAVTSDDGSYLLRYDANAGESVHLLVATTSHVVGRPVRVIRPDGLIHGFGAPSFAAAASSTQDVLVTDWSGLAPAFNVFDTLVTGMDYVVAVLGVAAPQPLYAHWVRGSTDGTYYWDSDNGMFLLGEASDDDGYDDTVILHEMGHYIEDAYGRSDSPGGSHDGSPTDPNLAWSEGFSTYFSLAVRGDPLYVDTNAGGVGFTTDGEGGVTSAPLPMGNMSQNVSEDMVTEILWDIADAPAADDDPLTSADDGLVLAVEIGYLDGPHTNRGVTGVDLVDWLDGWFVTYDLTTCAAVRQIVTATRNFPYDYAGPAGACPP